MERYYNTLVRAKRFAVGDLIEILTQAVDSTEGKLHANWEGPYKIVEATKP